VNETKIQTIKQWLSTGSINLFGQHFSGKDTQARILGEILSAPVVSGGQILRDSDYDSKEAVSQGQLAPTEDFAKIILPHLEQPKFDHKPLILSSVGKWIGEEQILIPALEKSEHPLKAVVLLNISEGEVARRWELAQKNGDRSHRDDDAKEFLDTRQREFDEKTIPVIEFYRNDGLLIEIDGNQTTDKVAEDTLEALFSRASASR
jgi:adenylate kinase